MVEKRKRSYSSDLRDEQARQTRRQVVAAAGRLYARDGFAATTVDAIAAEAGVSRKTVFSAVGGKVELLKLAYDYALAGDDEPIPMTQRPGLQEVIAETDPYKALTMYGTVVADMGRRIASLYVALQGAAEVDPQARELYQRWEDDRVRAMRMGPVPLLVKTKALRAGLRPNEAADVLATLNSPAFYHRFVTRGGWTHARFRRWLTYTMIEQVTKPRPADVQAGEPA